MSLCNRMFVMSDGSSKGCPEAFIAKCSSCSDLLINV